MIQGSLRISYYFLGLMYFQTCLLSYSLNAQAYHELFQHLSIENGLSNNSVNSVVQDNNGFIWIATENGLNKFNGYSSKLFYPHLQLFNQELITHIGSSFKDSKGRLWFGSKGLILCNPQLETFKIFQFDAANPNSIMSNDIFKIVEDEHSRIWIGTRNGLAMYNESTQDFTKFRHDTTATKVEIYSRNRIIDLVSDKNGNLWMTTLMGLYKYSIKKNIFTPYLLHPDKSGSKLVNRSHFMALDHTGKIWINYFGIGLFCFDTLSKKYEQVKFPQSEMNDAALAINSIQCDSKNNIWIASSVDGLLQFERTSSQWTHFKHDPFKSKSLIENKVSCIYEDKSGILWIGTNNKGVDRINPGHHKFLNLVLSPGNPNSICADDITCFAEDITSNLWIGSKNGLMYFDRSKNKFRCYTNIKNNQNSISDNVIYSLELDSLNNLWVATANGLNYYNTKNHRWTKYFDLEKDANSLPGNLVFDIKIKKNGSIWVATNNLIGRFVPETNSFISQKNNAIIDSLLHAYYITLFEDSEQLMWISTAKSGIYLIDDQYHCIKTYRKSNGFQANLVHQFNEDLFGTIWIASDQGIYFKLKDSVSIQKLKSNDLILNGDIKSIIPESDTSIWVSTLSGLIDITLDKNKNIKSYRTYNESNGLQSKAFNNFAGLKLNSGDFCFGGINGFNIFNPSQIKINTFIPPIKISSFKVHNLDIPFSLFAENNSTIELKYTENYFSFDMASLSYDLSEKNQYGYQLEGYDHQINYSKNTRNVFYNNIPPGQYKLHIIGSNNMGIWNMNGYILNIIIHPPFWQNLWFRILFISITAAAGYWIYYRRIKFIKQQEQNKADIEKQITEARSAALRAQMNPHFIFNSLNSIQHIISEHQHENAQRYLSKFSRLMRLILENSSKNMTTVASELKIIELYLELESLRFENKFIFQIDYQEDPSILDIEIPTLILQPFVENAIIHGLINKTGLGQLKIILQKNQSYLSCIIQDNGIGRDASMLINRKKGINHQSLGIPVTIDRIKMIETITNRRALVSIDDLKDENNVSKGTRVTIILPIELEE